MAFDLCLHVATLLALLTVYAKEWTRWIRRLLPRIMQPSPTGKETRALLFWIAIATVPAIVFGLFARGVIEWARTPIVAASTLIVFGLLLWGVDVWASRRPIATIEQLGWRRAFAMGCAQALALIPGISRSGIVLTAGRACGLSRSQAVQWAFLLSVPITMAAAMHVLFPLLRDGSFVLTIPMLVGMVSAWGTGVGAILLLRGVAEKASFGWFALYRVALGVAVLTLLLR